MDVFAFTVCLLVLCLGSLSTQLPQDLQTLNTNTPHNTSSIANSTAIKCNTAKGVPGSCIDRQFCDYSTYAIDLSLYATKDYKKPCAEKEACCPFSFQIQVTVEPKPTWTDEELTFDEDDKK